MLKVNRLTFIQFKHFSAFCLATSVSASVADPAQAATFSGDYGVSITPPASISNVLDVSRVSNGSGFTSTTTGSGTFSQTFESDLLNSYEFKGRVRGSTDSIVPGSAGGIITSVILGFSAFNRSDSVLTIPYKVSYGYYINSSVSESGLDNASADFSLSSSRSSVFNTITDSVTGNQSTGPITNEIPLSLTLNPGEMKTVTVDTYVAGSANTAVPVPEPASALSTLVFGAVSTGYFLRPQRKKQKSGAATL